MGSIDDQDVVQALFPDGADPTLSKGIGVWSSIRGVDDTKALGSKDGVEPIWDFGVIIVDQEAKISVWVIEFPE